MKDTRSGLWHGVVSTMHMHPECHAFEKVEGTVDSDWYEDIAEPAFDRNSAILYAKNNALKQT